MKKKYTLLTLISLLLSLSTGCARIPQSTGYHFSAQHKLQAAHHWDLLATDVADRINNALIDQEFLETPVYVHNLCDDAKEGEVCKNSTFAKGFTDLLNTHLVDFGVPTLAEKDESALIIDNKVQVVYHRSGRISRLWPGVLTSLTTGVIALYDAPWQAQALVTSILADTSGGARTINGHYEVIISTSIVYENRYLMRQSDIYYINDDDFIQYQQAVPVSIADIQLTSSIF